MIEEILFCQKCSLCKTQPPLLDELKPCQVMWVGLSAKIVSSDNETPLAITTNTGEIIHKIECQCAQIANYKTNLVKCVPTDGRRKIRYPNTNEINSCITHLDNELQEVQPKIVFLLGERVARAVCTHLSIAFKKWENFEYFAAKYHNTFFVSVHHPSYIYVYRRKQIDEYVDSIVKIIDTLLNS